MVRVCAVSDEDWWITTVLGKSNGQTMGKGKKKRELMKEWDPDETVGAYYNDLIDPIKRVFKDGYRVERYNTNQFRYTGYNIGEKDRLYHPSPAACFNPRWLENEAKHGRTLLDNIFKVIFLLGVEQGRRSEKNHTHTNELLTDILISRTKTIKELRLKLGEYDDAYLDDVPIPLENDDPELVMSFLEEPDDVDICERQRG